MLTRDECDQLAELKITLYCRSAKCASPDDVRKALELMISKAALAIAKYNDTATALEVLNRTVLNMTPAGGRS